MDIQKVKHFMRVDFEEDDVLIQSLVAMAKRYLKNAGVKEQIGNELYDHVVMMVATFFYDNRSGDKSNLPGLLNDFITQLSCE